MPDREVGGFKCLTQEHTPMAKLSLQPLEWAALEAKHVALEIWNFISSRVAAYKKLPGSRPDSGLSQLKMSHSIVSHSF